MKRAGRAEKLAVCALFACACFSAGAEVVARDTVERYSIGGANEADLRREMNAKGPSGNGARRFDAYTRRDIRWREYLAPLTEHENGHRKHGLDAAREIDRGIGALPAQANCNALGNAANAFGNEILRKYNERDIDYDRTTDHGRTQGARFP